MKEQKRSLGVLAPVSSLPSEEGIGTFGQGAYHFIDFLNECGVSIWQVLPLVPTGYGDSPYQSCCSYALSDYYIDLNILKRRGLLTEAEIASACLAQTPRRVDYGAQFAQKRALLRKAFSRFRPSDEFLSFLNEGTYRDYAVFMALKEKNGYLPFSEWADGSVYGEELIKRTVEEEREEYLFWQFTQFECLSQWRALKEYANAKGVKIMGDLPLYLSYDSVEMWKYGREIFLVDENLRPDFVAGVPPDAFSSEGQLWGNPLYDWEKMKENGYAWWKNRIENSFELFDLVRIDHFRGFDRFYAVPASHSNAQNGVWKEGPKAELFRDKLDWEIIAEDLGVLDDGVKRLMEEVGFPGMKILQFAFDGAADNEHKPSNYTANCVCYTGTHDNAPLKSFILSLSPEEFELFQKELEFECERAGIQADLSSISSTCESALKLAAASSAFLVILPLWDLMLFGEEARFNLPATLSCSNWSFRFLHSDFSVQLKNKLSDLVFTFRRNQTDT